MPSPLPDRLRWTRSFKTNEELGRCGEIDAQGVLPRVEPGDVGRPYRIGGENAGIADQRVDPSAGPFERFLPQHLRTGRLGDGTRDGGPHGVAVDAEGVGEVGDGDDDAAAEADALEVAAADEFVGRGTTDAEDLAGLFDGEGEGMIGSHTYVGREWPGKPRRNPWRPAPGELSQSVQSTTLGDRERPSGEPAGCP